MTLVSVVCFAFVDDTDLPMSTPTRTATGEELQPLFQAELDCWSGILTVTGGELDPKKLWCYIIDFEFDENK